MAERISRPMAKRKILYVQAECLERRLVCDTAQYQDNFQLGHGINTSDQKLAASIDFSSVWLVLRRYTAHGICDHDVIELYAIIRRISKCTLREAKSPQCRKQEFARGVPGERAARTMSTFQAGGEPDNQNARGVRSK